MDYSTDMTSLLTVIIDTNSVWWGQQLIKSNRQITFTQCVDAVLVFCNSHLLLNRKNQLCIIASHVNYSKFLYPKRDSGNDAGSDDGETTLRGKGDGRYELFANIEETVREELSDLVVNDRSGELHSDCLLAGAMSMALCYVTRMKKEHPEKETLSSRILVVKGSEDNPSQYMSIMNAVFTAQKLNIVIDACILDNESILLQQACDITDGTYTRIPQPAALLEYLLWIFLPDAITRRKLASPPKLKVDYRAACFCHRTLIDVGYVCSICLSIFCVFSPICSNCHATFKFLAPLKSIKKKPAKK